VVFKIKSIHFKQQKKTIEIQTNGKLYHCNQVEYDVPEATHCIAHPHLPSNKLTSVAEIRRFLHTTQQEKRKRLGEHFDLRLASGGPLID
jgi:hypothetical protein